MSLASVQSAPILTAKHEMEKDTAGCRAFFRKYTASRIDIPLSGDEYLLNFGIKELNIFRDQKVQALFVCCIRRLNATVNGFTKVIKGRMISRV